MAESSSSRRQKGSAPMEKDENELELEKRVFGDDEGFRQQIHDFEYPDSDAGFAGEDESNAQESNEDLNTDDAFARLDDADLFFVDSGAGASNPVTLPMQSGQDVEGSSDGNDSDTESQSAAWQDSDDERVAVSLASDPRLRKLRHTETDDVVSGKEYINRLRATYPILHPLPPWAKIPDGEVFDDGSSRPPAAIDDGDIEVDDEKDLVDVPVVRLNRLLGSPTTLYDPSNPAKKSLRPETVTIERLEDVGPVQPSAVTSLSFHPLHLSLLSSGPSSNLYMHFLNTTRGHATPITIHTQNTPIHTSCFSADGTRVLFSGRRKFFQVWNLERGTIEKVSRIYGHREEQKTMERFKMSPCGRYMALVGSGKKGGGVINLLDAHSLQWISQTRIESQGGVADFCFWRNGNGMAIAGKNGEISEWDIQADVIVARWKDEGAVGTTVLALGGRCGQDKLGDDRWVAVGSSSGIVNVYDRRPWFSEKTLPTNPKPTKVFDQLTTPIGFLNFSPDGQMLVMASRWKRDALRLIHLPSCTVYRNWPTSATPLGRISSVAFNPTSNLLAVGNERGMIRLWTILG